MRKVLNVCCILGLIILALSVAAYFLIGDKQKSKNEIVEITERPKYISSVTRPQSTEFMFKKEKNTHRSARRIDFSKKPILILEDNEERELNNELLDLYRELKEALDKGEFASIHQTIEKISNIIIK